MNRNAFDILLLILIMVIIVVGGMFLVLQFTDWFFGSFVEYRYPWVKQ